MAKKKRIFHGLSEVAGQGCLGVAGIRANQREAHMYVWQGSKFLYPFDYTLKIDKNKKFKAPIYAVKALWCFISSLTRYDVFHFHFGRSILLNHDLWVYHLFGKKVFFEFHGSDLRDAKKFKELNKYSPLSPVSNVKFKKRAAKICNSADGIILHDDELLDYLPVKRCPVYGVPLRTDPTRFVPLYPSEETKCVRIVHAPTNRAIKGTEHILEAIENLKKKYNVELVLVENRTHEEAKQLYQTADIIVDQLLIGIYSVFSIEGMLLGKPVVSYISDAMKASYPEELPIVSATIETIETELENLIKDGKLRNQLGKRGRKYAEEYHDYRKIGKMLCDIYDGSVTPAIGREAFSRIKELKLQD